MTTADPRDWFITHEGAKFSILNPQRESIYIEDIAHALSNICRFGGHTHAFYSVAQHSVRVSELVPAEHALTGLMHDAPEAYVGDVIRPLKSLLKDYAAIEDRIWRVIADVYRLPVEMDPCIKVADREALVEERKSLISGPGYAAYSMAMPALPPAHAYKLFLNRFEQLTAVR